MQWKTFIAVISLCLINITAQASSPSKHDVLKQFSNYVQDVSGRETLSLNGQWQYIIDPYENGYYNYRYQPYDQGYFRNKQMVKADDLIEYNFSDADSLQVPGDWNTQKQALMFYEGTIWYHKEFNISTQQDKRYLINFGAVNYHAIVYVNGEKVGSHEGGFTSFQFDITDHLNSGDNFVTLKVDNARERDQVPTVNTDWWNYGGITREVNIITVPETYISNYRIELADNRTDMISGEVWLAGKELSSKIKAKTKIQLNIPELGIKQTIRADQEGKFKFSIKAQPNLWSPEQPKLYQVNLGFNGENLQDTIGFKSIKSHGNKILLNGEQLFLRGISIHEESPLTYGRAWSEADARVLLTWAKELGCNFVRLAHYPHNKAMLKVADELGLLVWSEIPVYWTVMFNDALVYNKAESQLVEMLRRDINRVSIALWSVANETPNSNERLAFLTSLVNTARDIDNSRLYTAAMDTHSSSKKGVIIDDPLIAAVDVIGINHYCGWYYSKSAKCANIVWENPHSKPVIVSEFGAGALQGKHGQKHERWTEEFQADLYKFNLEMVMNIPGIQGVSPWVLKDFRSPRRPLAKIQDFWNRKGLLSESGIKKQAWYVLNAFYKNQEKQAQKKNQTELVKQ